MGDRLGIPRVVDFSFSRLFDFPYMHFCLLFPPIWDIADVQEHKQPFTAMASLKTWPQNMTNTAKIIAR